MGSLAPSSLSAAACALLGALAVLALGALVAALRRGWRRRQGRARQRHGAAGERHGRTLLEGAGWRVVAEHPALELVLHVDGEARARPVTPDYLCHRGGRTLPAEVKTGQCADLDARPTRRQLLEYATACGSDAALFVDADAGTVREVRFPGRGAPPRWRPAPLLVAALLGAAAGFALGRWLLTGGR